MKTPCAARGWKVAVRRVVDPAEPISEGFFQAVSAAGFQAVHLECAGAGLTEAICQTIKAQAVRAGVNIAGYCPHWPSQATWVSDSRERRREGRDHTLACLDQAALLHARALALPADAISLNPSRRGTASYEDAYTRAEGMLLDIRFEAERRAVVLACPVPAEHFLLSPLEVREFLDRINSPWVRAQISLEAAALASDPRDWIRVLGHRSAAIVLEDGFMEMPDPDGLSIHDALRRSRFEGSICFAGQADLPALWKRASAMLANGCESRGENSGEKTA